MNGQVLAIDPAVFQTSNNRGTIVDSGTTLAYLAEEAYDPFVSAVSFNRNASLTRYIFLFSKLFQKGSFFSSLIHFSKTVVRL